MTGARERLGKKLWRGGGGGRDFISERAEIRKCVRQGGCVSARWENRERRALCGEIEGGKPRREGGNQPGGRLRKAVLAQRRALRSRWALI